MKNIEYENKKEQVKKKILEYISMKEQPCSFKYRAYNSNSNNVDDVKEGMAIRSFLNCKDPITIISSLRELVRDKKLYKRLVKSVSGQFKLNVYSLLPIVVENNTYLEQSKGEKLSKIMIHLFKVYIVKFKKAFNDKYFSMFNKMDKILKESSSRIEGLVMENLALKDKLSKSNFSQEEKKNLRSEIQSLTAKLENANKIIVDISYENDKLKLNNKPIIQYTDKVNYKENTLGAEIMNLFRNKKERVVLSAKK